MLNEKMEEAINEQINKEMYSSYLYLAMSAYSSAKGLPGFAHWFRIQVEEETIHAMKFFDYLNRQGANVKLKEIQEPPMELGTPLEMFQKTLEHEQFITRSIRELLELAVSEKDYATSIFLQWFVTERVEEENNDNTIIDQLKLVGEKGNGLFMLDRELGNRTYTAPAEGE